VSDEDKWPFSRCTWVSWYQNVSILDFVEAKGDGGAGNNWSYKMRKDPFKMSTNRHCTQVFSTAA